MKNRIFHNWVLKVSSVVCAIALWIIVYTIEDPADYRRMYNVPVTFINTEMITENGQVYEVLDGTDVVRSITIRSTSSVINDLKDNDINVEADFSKMKLDGTIELNLYSDRHNDSITFSSSASEVKVLVEDKVDRSISLELALEGEPADSYIVGNTKLAQNRISVTGAESIANSVEKAVAVVDITDASEDIFAYADIVLYDAQGQEVPKDRLDVSMKTVSTTVEILGTKTVPIRYVAEGTTGEGYVATGEIFGDYSQITIAGDTSVLAGVSEILVQGEKLAYEDATADVVTIVDLDDYLPEGVTRADRTHNGRISVTVQIAPIEEKTLIYRMGQVEIINVPEGYEVEHQTRSAEINIVVRGSKYLLEDLTVANIHGTLDVTAWMEANNISRLGRDAVYKMDASFDAGEGLEVISAAPIEVIATIKEE